jgi:L-fuculokinase
MPPNDKSIAVFDVGKTNKKLIVFDDRLRQVDSAYHTFEEHQQGGVSVEAVREAVEWLYASLAEMAARHDIGAISVSTHGAAFACVDRAGSLALPVLSYTIDPGREFVERFSAEFGDPITLQRTTKTPDMVGLACMAKGIRFVQERWPEAFGKTAAILPLPQYYGFVLTGRKAIEPTFIGCHTALWDFEKNDWSTVCDRLGVRALLPGPMKRPWDALGTITPDVAQRTGLSEDTVVAVGIHDSNAAILPYLIKMAPPFVVNSTGTVTVSMSVTKDTALAEEELGKIIYYKLSAFSSPIKTAIFYGGTEFDTYLGALAAVRSARPHPGFDARLAEDILTERRSFILPSLVPFGMFPDSPPRVVEGDRVIPLGELLGGKYPDFFNDYERAYTILVLSIALQSEVTLRSVGLADGIPLFIEGGFSKNEVYTNLVASLFPGSQTATTSLSEAAAFGAALVGRAALLGTDPHGLSDLFEIEARPVPARRLAGLGGYREEFLRLVRGA